MAKILWVEDQSHWIEKFKGVLAASDFDGQPNEVNIFQFSEAARQQIALMAKEDKPDVAILDARMNGYDAAGFSVLNALRKKWPGIPIIFLSEYNGTDIEREALSEYDAADFISKHQRNIDEVLCWRIKAVLRQSATQNNPRDALPSNILSSGPLRMDLDTWEVYWKGVKLMNPDNPKRPLAPTPRKILRCLVERAPRPVSTAQMAEYLGVDPEKYAYATYRQHIKTLRRAFDHAENRSGTFLETCKAGYGIITFGEEGAYCWKPLPNN
jgi:two-component system OmpR family response regulator